MTETPQPPEPQKPAAGYYPDSTGVQRYWDGNAWTEQTQPGPPAAPTATVTAGNPKADAKAAKAYAKASRPWFKKKRWWAAGIVLIIIIAAAAGSGGSSDDGPEKVGDGSSSSNDSGKDDKKAGSESNPIKVGETVKLKGTQYTVKSAKVAPEVGGEFFKEKANGIYVIVELTIENKKDETKTFLSNAATFIGGNNKKYDTDSDGSIAADEPLILEDMQPDVPKTGTLVYDVPKDATKGGVLKVSDLFGSGDAYIDLGL